MARQPSYYLQKAIDAAGADIRDRADVRDAMEADTAALIDVWRTSRTVFDRMNTLPRIPDEQTLSADELVIGGGLHAAIYAATTQARTERRVAVIEAERLGGVFALAEKPVFYLNSRNRPGQLGLPGTSAALNVIPDGVIQPADLNGLEYQTNAEFAFVIRANLAMYADVYRGRATSILNSGITSRRYRVNCENGRVAFADRVILATGVGTPRLLSRDDDSVFLDPETILGFNDFLRLVDTEPFPLNGRTSAWRNVAVIGPGDGGCAVIEYLLGQGPTAPDPASLDTVERITWYGQECVSKEEFESIRSRYAGIGRYMPRESDPDRYYRVRPNPARVTSVVRDRDGARVINEFGQVSEAFDHVVVCVGNEPPAELVSPTADRTLSANEAKRLPVSLETITDENNQPIGRQYVGTEIFKVGPCADLPITREDREAGGSFIEQVPPNSAASWRYALRTQAMARRNAERPFVTTRIVSGPITFTVSS